VVVLKRIPKGWLFEALQTGAADCGGVRVRGVTW
jgi:hypothetical protein